jgi:hypothetical protein
MPFLTVFATTRRHAACADSICALKKGSSKRLVRFGFLSNASLILPRKAERMMQPPHHCAHPFLLQLYDDFGPKRLYWGSDFSPALEHVSFPQTIDALFQLGWPAADLQRIMHGNLTKLILGSGAGGTADRVGSQRDGNRAGRRL